MSAHLSGQGLEGVRPKQGRGLFLGHDPVFDREATGLAAEAALAELRNLATQLSHIGPHQPGVDYDRDKLIPAVTQLVSGHSSDQPVSV